MTTPAGPAGPPPRGPGRLMAWARRNPALAAAAAAAGGLGLWMLHKRSQANTPADTAGADTTNTPAGTIPGQFDGTGTSDPFGTVEQQIGDLQAQLGRFTAGQNPAPAPGFSFWQLARQILVKRGEANPTPAQIGRERRRLIRLLGPAPAGARKPPPARRLPGGRIVVGRRR